ncbi:MAG: GDP-L-fucose synthase, partial [Methanoregula sp.]|nr:GDP-L-fucose synthase [Methanoregula sp.]
TGMASREFLYVDDAARGIILAAERYNKPDPVNLGAGMEITIRDLVALIQELTDYSGEIQWDTTKPDGQPKRSLDVSRAKREFGFEAQMPFREGLKRTIAWYENHRADTEQPHGAGDHC